ncbi:MAG: hypothetical protein HY261_06125 [Chloroflexi bacterium]|nr:hypothetical protein [Chloroflexota bacterium]
MRIVTPVLAIVALVVATACGGSTTMTATVAPSPSTPAAGASPTSVASARSATWTPVASEADGPGARRDASLVFDGPRQRLLLFGGRRGGQPLADLWAYDLKAGRWSQIAAPSGPAARFGHVAATDAKRNQMVVFTGQGSKFFNDAWMFDLTSNQWRDVTPSSAKPAERYGSCIGYDDVRDVFYISHGFTNQGRFDDTWAWNPATQQWADVSPQSGMRPIKRCLHRCSYDTQSSGMLLFGGQSNEIAFLGDLWRYDPVSKTWTEQKPDGFTPAPRMFSSFDAVASGRFVVYGGNTTTGPVDDVWLYDTRAGWQQVSVRAGPSSRASEATAVDPQTGALYVFGGVGDKEFGDLWRLTPNP